MSRQPSSRAPDRWIGMGALAVVLLLAGLIVAAVRDAEANGRESRADLRLEQVEQLANSMEARIQAAYASLLSGVGAPGRFTLQPANPADTALLQPQNPASRTGSVLVDSEGVVVNGALLRDPGVIGRRLDRDGLQRALAGEPTILPVGPGLTTSLPTIAVAIPVRAASGQIAGAYLTEVEVSAASAFNQEVAELQTGDSSRFSFVDENGVVVASSHEDLLSEPLIGPAIRGFEPGFHRADGRVAAVADVPSGPWKLVFQQSIEDFEGDLVGPLRSALVLLGIAALVAGGVAVLALTRRLRRAREEERRLLQLNREHEEFTSIVSHELRTPVAGLVGFLQTTLDHWEAMPEADRRSAVRRAWANAHHLHTLTRDVLDTGRVDADELAYDFGVVDLRTAVADAVEDARQVQPARPFRLEDPGGALWVRGDAHRVHQVLTNLLDNAMKNSPEDSPVAVMLRADGAREGEVAVAVTDRGAGIPPSERERVFDKYVRGRGATTRGSGLGLYISRSIVEGHGGRIWAGASPTGGANITFTLPLAESPSAAPADRPSVGSAPPGGGLE